MNKKLILFDLDGTLIDSGPDLAASLNFMLQKLGRETFSDGIIHTWVGNGAQTLVKRALVGKKEIDKDVDETLFQRALKIFLEHYEQHVCVKTYLFANVATTLEQLHKNYKMAIVTNKPSAFVAPILETLAIKKYFDAYIGADSLEKKKPHPMPLEYMCKKFACSVEESIMVGDSKNDILAANALGMQSIGVEYGYNYGESIEVHKPTFVVKDFAEILDILGEEVAKN